MLRVAERYADGSLGLVLFDFQRSGYMETWDPAHAEALHTSSVLSDAWDQCVFDSGLAGQWEALRDLSDGSLGREIVKFYDVWVRPSRAAPTVRHLCWRSTTGSTCSRSTGRPSRASWRCSASSPAPTTTSRLPLLAMVISLFETGYLASGVGLFQYDRGTSR